MRPPRLATIRSSGAAVFLHECAGCGGNAPFGVGVNLRKEQLGTWWCGPAGCRKTKAEAPKSGAQAALF